jgi:SSS family transporter
MVAGFVVAYLVGTVVIGLVSARLVKNSKDFIVAGRRLPLYMSATALFATWFGAETMLGASSRINNEGLMGAIEDPFGASLCLFLIGAVFARPLYRSNLLTFGDFFRKRYDHRAEFLSAVFIVVSYFGWVAAQIVALGILFNTVTGLPIAVSMLVGISLVVLYTFFGGMWAVSITDFVQTFLIIASLIAICVILAGQAGGVMAVLEDRPDGFYRIVPEWGLHPVLEYMTAWMAIGLGSIPQQDLFQRINSAKSEKVAVRAAYVGGLMYLTVAMMPLFVAMTVRNLQPELLALDDHQVIVPMLIRLYTNPVVQVLFYGALLSAILSTASAAILAPSVIISENLIRPHFPRMSDRRFLWITRFSILVVAAISIVLALPQGAIEGAARRSAVATLTGPQAPVAQETVADVVEDAVPGADVGTGRLPSIFELVANSYTATLVALLVPLTAGIYWRRANTRGCLASMGAGLIAWAASEYVLDWGFAAKVIGFVASVLGMLIGSWWPRGSDTTTGKVTPAAPPV